MKQLASALRHFNMNSGMKNAACAYARAHACGDTYNHSSNACKDSQSEKIVGAQED